MASTRPPTRQRVHARRLLAAVGMLAIVTTTAVVAHAFVSGESSSPVLEPRVDAAIVDPLAYDGGKDGELEEAAAFGLSHPLYAKSPGGVFATAKRTARYRELVERASSESDLDPDLVEAIVFLESAGRPEVIAGDDPAGASGLTQILAETATNFLGMDVDLARSRELTRRIAEARARGDDETAARLRAERRAVDSRFRPAAALAGTARYLTQARERLGRDDLAIVAYHMGIGNLTDVIRSYAAVDETRSIPDVVAEHELSWARIFFDSTPIKHAYAYRRLARLEDDSPTYYWRVLAAREIMRLYRDDPDRLQELARLQTAKGSAEEVLHPYEDTQRFADGADLERAWTSRVLHPVPDEPARTGFAIDRTLGELASRLDRPRSLYEGLRAEALALLAYLAGRVQHLSGATQPLNVTSAVRDDEYQDLLRRDNPEATKGYSLHTTGYAFDVRRRYQSDTQAAAFQFELDDLAARGLIAWVREPGAIHITVSSDADELVPAMLAPAEGRPDDDSD